MIGKNPAEAPHNYLRQSLQLLVRLLEQLHQHLQALEVRMEALESGSRRTGELPPGSMVLRVTWRILCLGGAHPP